MDFRIYCSSPTSWYVQNMKTGKVEFKASTCDACSNYVFCCKKGFIK